MSKQRRSANGDGQPEPPDSPGQPHFPAATFFSTSHKIALVQLVLWDTFADLKKVQHAHAGLPLDDVPGKAAHLAAMEKIAGDLLELIRRVGEGR